MNHPEPPCTLVYMSGDWETLAGLLAERGWNLAHAAEQRQAASRRLAQAVARAAAAGMPETRIAVHAGVTRRTVRNMLGKPDRRRSPADGHPPGAHHDDQRK